MTKRKRKRGHGKLYEEARRESRAGRKKEKSDLHAQVVQRVAKAPRKERVALRKKLKAEISARWKLFGQTFPSYRRLKSKDVAVVRRLIENLKTWRLGINI